MLARVLASVYCAAQHNRDMTMASQNLPQEPLPLTPFGYWQESLATWAEFSQRSGKILMTQIGRGRAKPDAESETLTAELLRTWSDLNLRHWQNTARLLESFPAWAEMPKNMAGSALVDWFDNFQKRRLVMTEALNQDPKPALVAPKTLKAPDGVSDDLTRIKGIGPKLSALLNELGIFHFRQIADWSDAEARWVDDYLSFKGRVAREAWIAQATSLLADGSTTVH